MSTIHYSAPELATVLITICNHEKIENDLPNYLAWSAVLASYSERNTAAYLARYGSRVEGVQAVSRAALLRAAEQMLERPGEVHSLGGGLRYNVDDYDHPTLAPLWQAIDASSARYQVQTFRAAPPAPAKVEPPEDERPIEF